MVNFGEALHIFLNCPIRKPVVYLRKQMLFFFFFFFLKLHIEASVVQWLCHSPCKPGVAGSISGFSSPSDGTINRGPISI